jgi:non-ribosomal peptide synthetase component F
VTLTWFRPPAGDDPGSLNLCYHAVDIAVIRGAAVETAVRHPGGELDYATLLERVAALAGAFRGLGVVPGTPVGVLLDDPLDELLALLATARLGATVVALDPADPGARIEEHRPLLVATSQPITFAGHVPAACVLRGIEPQDPTRDLDWELAVRAGRTDPAPCAPVAPGTPAYVGGRVVTTVDRPSDDSAYGRAVAALAARTPVDLTAAR